MEDIIKEKALVDYPLPVTIDKTQLILEQMKNCICKIENKNGNGTKFFCYIPYKGEKYPVLITNNHVIDETIIKENQNIRITINNDKIEKKNKNK